MFPVVGVREVKVAGGEEDCCEGVQEERRTGPGLSLLQSGQTSRAGLRAISHHGVVQVWLVKSCLVGDRVGVGGDLLIAPPRHTEHDEVHHPQDGDGFEAPVVQVDNWESMLTLVQLSR